MLTSFPIISLTILILVFTAIAVQRSARSEFAMAMTACIAVLGMSLYSLLVVNTEPSGIHLEESLGSGNIAWHAGLDGVSMIFLLLTSTLGPIILLYARYAIEDNKGSIFAAILLYQAILIGALTALNLLQFWCFLLLELIPIRMMSGAIMGNKPQLPSVITRYWALMLGMILAAMLIIVLGSTGESSAVLDHQYLSTTANLETATVCFILLFFGLSVRLPIFPFHGWLPELVNSNKTIPVFCFIAGVKIGIYGLYRFATPLLPAGEEHWTGLITTIALFCIFYGALLALMQININRLLAFAIISHNGMLVIGLFTGNAHSLEGSILLSIAFGIASTGLILSSAFIHRASGTAFIPRLGNLFEKKTAAALLFLLAALSTMAMPGTPGYNAAHILLEGVIENSGWQTAIVILIGNVLAAAFLLRAFQQIFIADSRRPVSITGKKATQHQHGELLICVILGLMLIISGIYPLAAWLERAL
jgi:NADH-quinone oxidoreductase subunit M